MRLRWSRRGRGAEYRGQPLALSRRQRRRGSHQRCDPIGDRVIQRLRILAPHAAS